MSKTKEEMLEEIEDKAALAATRNAPYIISAILGVKHSIENRAQPVARSSCKNLKVSAFEVTIGNEAVNLDKTDALVKELTDKYVEVFAHKVAEGISAQKNIKLKCGKIDRDTFPPDVKFFIEM